jgi:hypothetical protein
MKRFCLIGLFFVLALSQAVQAVKTASAPAPQGLERVTLYSLNKYPSDYGRALFSFKSGAFVRNLDLWDLNYGSLYVGDEWDWFSVSLATNARTAARDLGELNWGDGFNVPVIEPFPKLKEGETRTIKVDSSGADGADGADGDGKLRPKLGSPKKRSGVPIVDPVFVKAILGHMYVVRVVDNDSDFYVLFRVEALERGDYCTISWQRIPSPEESVNDK